MKVCHELLATVWEKARSFVHSDYGIPSKKHMLRLLRHTCEKQVPSSRLNYMTEAHMVSYSFM